MTYILLQAPNNGYYWIVSGGSKKHFELEDKGCVEIASGSYEEMRDMVPDDQDLIRLYCHKTFSEIQTTEECLHQMIANEPDYLNNKEFI